MSLEWSIEHSNSKFFIDQSAQCLKTNCNGRGSTLDAWDLKLIRWMNRNCCTTYGVSRAPTSLPGLLLFWSSKLVPTDIAPFTLEFGVYLINLTQYMLNSIFNMIVNTCVKSNCLGLKRNTIILRRNIICAPWISALIFPFFRSIQPCATLYSLRYWFL